ncbi:MAG: hypothetical protein L6V93_05875 [Clostridiales bacterium]|nr:MAG: hypothetical protein L6V93_05875 [Clostridiales bacterium]
MLILFLSDKVKINGKSYTKIGIFKDVFRRIISPRKTALIKYDDEKYYFGLHRGLHRQRAS